VELLLELQTVDTTNRGEISDIIKQLLAKYQHLFVKPHDLPPNRSVDHAIEMILGELPFRLRPYRYTPQQKDEIKKQV
jgi:hypothetical protein